jgi:hypothetical protein
MAAPPKHLNAKYDVMLMMGDFNAKIGDEKHPPPGMPPRLGYPGVCLAGKRLISSIDTLDWIVLNNRKTKQLIPTRHSVPSDSIVESSIIDHILGKPADWPLIEDEKTHAWSGTEIASSDHNLLTIDMTLTPSVPGNAHVHAGPDSLHDRFQPLQEPTVSSYTYVHVCACKA